MNQEASNVEAGRGLGAATLFGIPVSVFIWDGTKPSLAVIDPKHQAHVVGDLLHFRGKRGNASICKGGWLLFFAGELSDFGYKMPSAITGTCPRRRGMNNTLDVDAGRCSVDRIVRLLNAITEALREMDKCPNDSVQDIWNESLESWETGLRMDHNLIIEPNEQALRSAPTADVERKGNDGKH